MDHYTIDIWLIYLPLYFSKVSKFYCSLAEDQKQRANRFLFEKHRLPFIISQGFLRKIIAEYIFISPEKIEFATGTHGKPYLPNSELKFNMSRSKDYALYGVTLHDEIGVDIEAHRERSHLEGIINSQFSQLEATQYHNLPKENRIDSFYKGWACKEAFIKAIGLGLYYPLRDFTVDMDPRQPAKLIADKNTNPEEWKLTMLMAPPTYSAALSIRSSFKTIQYRKLLYNV